MAGFTTYYATQLVNNLFRTAPSTPGGWTNITRPATIYVALFTTAPTDAYTSGSPTGVECSGGSYARVAVTQADAQWSGMTGTPLAFDNTNAITFAQASASWGDVLAFGIFDAVTTGNLLWWGTVSPTRTVSSGATASFAAGTLDLTLD